MNLWSALVPPFVKQLRRVEHPRPVSTLLLTPRSVRDFSKDVGDGLGSSVIMAPVQFIMRVFPEARPMMWRKDGMKRTPVPDHELLALLEHPNPFYDGAVLWSALVVSWATSGNAYFLKVRGSVADRPRELWYTPHWLVEPKGALDGSTFIDRYEYRPQSRKFDLDPDDVSHLRHGINPRNVRIGLSPLDSVLREVFTDEEASNYTASMLRNVGVPGVVISPAVEGFVPSEEDVERTKQEFIDRFTGDRRGEPMVMSGPTKVETLGFSPAEMNLGDIRNISEERVCAALGIPAAVVGFGTGLQQTKVGATMKELVRLAWMAGIIPMQRLFAAEVKRSLVPEFEPDPENWIFGFDTSEVEALQETETERSERLAKLVAGGVITVATAQRTLGFEVDETQEVYLRSVAMIERPAGVADFEPAATIEAEPTGEEV